MRTQAISHGRAIGATMAAASRPLGTVVAEQTQQLRCDTAGFSEPCRVYSRCGRNAISWWQPEAGDTDARRRLVDAFMPAIVTLAGGIFSGRRVERQELVQEGVAGLLVAARRYDAGLNTRFWAYASFWVRKAMQELVAELARPVALS